MFQAFSAYLVLEKVRWVLGLVVIDLSISATSMVIAKVSRLIRGSTRESGGQLRCSRSTGFYHTKGH